MSNRETDEEIWERCKGVPSTYPQPKFGARKPSCFERDRILAIIEETAQRYSRGSVTRVALDNLALEIRERG